MSSTSTSIQALQHDLDLPIDRSTLSLLEQSVDAVWIVGLDGRIVYATASVQKTYSLGPVPLGQTLDQLEFFDTRIPVVCDYLQALQDHKHYQNDQFLFSFKHRAPSVARVVGQPLFDSEGQYKGYLTSAIDLGGSGVVNYMRDRLAVHGDQAVNQPEYELDHFVQTLQQTLGIDSVMISGVEGSKMDVLSFYQRGVKQPVYALDIHGTPCEKTLEQGSYIVLRDMPRHYADVSKLMEAETYMGYRLDDVQGKPMGLLCAFHGQELVPVEVVAQVLDSASTLIAPVLSHYLGGKRFNDQTSALTQAYRLAKVGTWLNYPGRGTKPRWSPETFEVWGLAEGQEPDLKLMFDQVHPEDQEKVAYHWNNLESIGSYTLEYRITDSHGRIKWLLESAETELDEQGAYRRVVGVIQDISEQKRDEEQLRTLAHAVFESSSIVYTLDRRARIVDCNPAFEECTGYSREEVLGQPGTILNTANTPRVLYWGLWRKLLSGQEWRGETENKRCNGEHYWAQTVITPVRNSNGEVISYLCVQEDITEKKRQDAMLRHQAYHDGLTGLANRRKVQEELEELLKKQQAVSLLFIDLDGFKYVNDSLGHIVGDGLLQRVGKRLQSTIREADLLARLGGDEFLVVLESNSDAELTAERILKVLSHPFEISGRIMHLGASIGIVTSPDDGDTSEVLLRNADAAMYHAKSKGKNTYSVFSSDIYRHSARRMQLEIGLRHALQRGELRLHYQPQKFLADGRLFGAEALCRWYSHELGDVSPSEFIPLAEEIGLIDDLGDWVVREALRSCRQWREAGVEDVVVSINVSPRQLRSDSLLTTISGALKEFRLPASALCVEVTETLLMDSYDKAQSLLNSLRELGVSLAIDDFGVGYSSLSYLKRFPFDSLKIDRSFVGDMENNEDDHTLIRTIVQLGHNLGLKVVAEGVENQAQQDLLTAIGCDAIQGYWLSKPIDGDSFLDLVVEQTVVSC
ncbi:hypothetical protein R50073_20670 [Maricurvus nonylphenolicus]|uniref:EAL domain-containing protein n=1 Tax=Maricurvus nonylphenolicus TaxID=1008307 RepID=UPI0036F3C5CF